MLDCVIDGYCAKYGTNTPAFSNALLSEAAKLNSDTKFIIGTAKFLVYCVQYYGYYFTEKNDPKHCPRGTSGYRHFKFVRALFELANKASEALSELRKPTWMALLLIAAAIEIDYHLECITQLKTEPRSKALVKLATEFATEIDPREVAEDVLLLHPAYLIRRFFSEIE